jgi:hypothetical protein
MPHVHLRQLAFFPLVLILYTYEKYPGKAVLLRGKLDNKKKSISSYAFPLGTDWAKNVGGKAESQNVR